MNTVHDMDSLGASLHEQQQVREMKAKLLQRVAASLREQFEKPGNFTKQVPKRELINKRLIKSLVGKLKKGGYQLRELENIETQLNLNRAKAPLAAQVLPQARIRKPPAEKQKTHAQNFIRRNTVLQKMPDRASYATSKLQSDQMAIGAFSQTRTIDNHHSILINTDRQEASQLLIEQVQT